MWNERRWTTRTMLVVVETFSVSSLLQFPVSHQDTLAPFRQSIILLQTFAATIDICFHMRRGSVSSGCCHKLSLQSQVWLEYNRTTKSVQTTSFNFILWHHSRTRGALKTSHKTTSILIASANCNKLQSNKAKKVAGERKVTEEKNVRNCTLSAHSLRLHNGNQQQHLMCLHERRLMHEEMEKYDKESLPGVGCGDGKAFCGKKTQKKRMIQR